VITKKLLFYRNNSRDPKSRLFIFLFVSTLFIKTNENIHWCFFYGQTRRSSPTGYKIKSQNNYAVVSIYLILHQDEVPVENAD